MAYIKADCSLIKKDGQVIGVSLVAQPQIQAKKYCNTMPAQLAARQGEIKFEDGKIIFCNPDGDGYPGEVSFFIEDGDATALQSILEGEQDLGIYDDGVQTPGFKIVPEEMKEEGQKTQLTRL